MTGRGETRSTRLGRIVAAGALALCLGAGQGAPPAAAQQPRWPGPQVEPRLTPQRVIRAGERIGPEDVSLRKGPGEGLRDIAQVAGLEAKVTLFPGRPIAAGDLAPPAAIERNQIVTVRFRRGALLIEAGARALDRAATGGRIRVMNLVSRATVVGVVVDSQTVEVGG